MRTSNGKAFETLLSVLLICALLTFGYACSRLCRRTVNVMSRTEVADVYSVEGGETL